MFLYAVKRHGNISRKVSLTLLSYIVAAEVRKGFETEAKWSYIHILVTNSHYSGNILPKVGRNQSAITEE